ncbi:recombinase family protein [Lysobacter enzymogenes]|uniref:Resolvase/invertase-type recombinase catalytic domain-containing protein n=1 Tax=Lysobacter enzymogenes TaxID=69 RepID=A0A3N2RNC4_LYSEN|nr:recombinase family protein [Lysobacter enzymogenes]ROU08960.1 hypothetical protein D9T17_02450 [Lysobacter enzymogenes]
MRSSFASRLSRSLRDFHKLWDLLAEHNVEFVSVTQQFNTTDAISRLMLNVLLSFGQFRKLPRQAQSSEVELPADRWRASVGV